MLFHNVKGHPDASVVIGVMLNVEKYAPEYAAGGKKM
jgi:hypothetical protein